MRHDTVFSIAGTASGQLYAAFLPESVVRPLYAAERRGAERSSADDSSRAAARALPSWAQFAKATLVEVRAQGLGRSDGAVVAGVSALSAPVFDHRGDVVLALTMIGPSAALDTHWGGAAAQALRGGAAAESARLGHRPGEGSGLRASPAPAHWRCRGWLCCRSAAAIRSVAAGPPCRPAGERPARRQDVIETGAQQALEVDHAALGYAQEVPGPSDVACFQHESTADAGVSPHGRAGLTLTLGVRPGRRMICVKPWPWARACAPAGLRQPGPAPPAPACARARCRHR